MCVGALGHGGNKGSAGAVRFGEAPAIGVTAPVEAAFGVVPGAPPAGIGGIERACTAPLALVQSASSWCW